MRGAEWGTEVAQKQQKTQTFGQTWGLRSASNNVVIRVQEQGEGGGGRCGEEVPPREVVCGEMRRGWSGEEDKLGAHDRRWSSEVEGRRSEKRRSQGRRRKEGRGGGDW